MQLDPGFAVHMECSNVEHEPSNPQVLIPVLHLQHIFVVM